MHTVCSCYNQNRKCHTRLHVLVSNNSVKMYQLCDANMLALHTKMQVVLQARACSVASEYTIVSSHLYSACGASLHSQWHSATHIAPASRAHTVCIQLVVSAALTIYKSSNASSKSHVHSSRHKQVAVAATCTRCGSQDVCMRCGKGAVGGERSVRAPRPLNGSCCPEHRRSNLKHCDAVSNAQRQD
jgi:hypothetical protein